MATFDTTRLIAQVTLKGALPDGRFSDQEILDLASDALIGEIAPMLIASREEYYIQTKDHSVVAATASYAIPYRAVGSTLREVKLIQDSKIIDLFRFDPEDITSTASGPVQGFYLAGNNIVLYPTPDSSGDTLRLTYFVRPSTLVPVNETARITAIAGNVLTASIPTSWTTSSVLDLVQGTSGFSLKAMDLACNAVSSSEITLVGTLPSDLAVGDYVTLAGESCFPHIPADAQQLLMHLTVVACLEAMGDQSNLPIAMKRAEGLRQSFAMLLTSRIQGSPRKFISNLI
jgi:hypothetical protein